MFKPDLCDFCGDCLVLCQWMEIEPERAADLIRAMMDGDPTEVTQKCITCYACNEICPQQANPFDLIAVLQEKQQVISEQTVQETETRYFFDGDLRETPPSDRIISTCVFGKSDAHLIQGELYDLPQVGGKPYFCWVLFSHMAAESIQKKHAAEFVNRLSDTGAKEVICFHDDCYAMLAKLAPEYGIEVPFRPIHLAEYLVEYLQNNKSRIKKLGLRLAYQRPCASRHTPEKEHFIDSIFEFTGSTRVTREFDRGKALCCASTKFLLHQVDPRSDQEKNIQDALQAGAVAMVCLCPMCMHSLATVAAENKMPLIFLGDLARMALGEIASPV